MNNQIENKDCDNCIKRANLCFNTFKESSEENSKYTSFVFSLGYVTMITIFTTIHKQLMIRPKATFICLFLISIMSFIANEIWKMIMDNKLRSYKSELWMQNIKGEINLEQLASKTNKYELELFQSYEKFYSPSFWISLICGFLAAIILVLECLYLIF